MPNEIITPRINIIGTPIGNLGDITYRAVEYLKNSEIIVCEDTRRSIKLLNYLSIKPKRLISLNDHNELNKSNLVTKLALEGKNISYISDAGMPCICDPGYNLINLSIKLGIDIEVIPGPCSMIVALVASGFPSDSFYFGGFIPIKKNKRDNELKLALNRTQTSIYFESPYRILKTIENISRLDKFRMLFLARELTKKFQTYYRGNSEGILEELCHKKIKGEITLVIKGKEKIKNKKINKYNNLL